MPTALVTGASAGIGEEFATQLASQGHNLVLVARDTQRLQALANKLSSTYAVECEVLSADLSDRQALGTVARRVADTDRPIDVLVNNAGFGVREGFMKSSLDDEEAMLDVLVRAPMVLTHAAGPVMRKRGYGRIINVSSVASFMATGSYSAAKSYITVLSESLNSQLQGTGVTVTAVCPGFTRTEFHERANIKAKANNMMWLDVQGVVAEAIRAAELGKSISVPGLQYKAITAVMKVLPRKAVSGQLLVRRHRPSTSSK